MVVGHRTVMDSHCPRDHRVSHYSSTSVNFWLKKVKNSFFLRRFFDER